MFKIDLKLMAVAALASAVMVGCGGDSSGDGNGGDNGGGGPDIPPMQQTITDVADYIRNLIASAGENSAPIDVNALTLVPNDQGVPASVN